MRTVLTFVLAAGLAGCSLAETDPTPNIRLTNGADVPIVYLAWEREASNTFDPNPTLPRAEYADRLVQEGATTDVEPITGGWGKRDDLRFFVYAAPEGAETATLTRILDAQADELRRQDYHVRVDSLQSGIRSHTRRGVIHGAAITDRPSRIALSNGLRFLCSPRRLESLTPERPPSHYARTSPT